MGIMSVLVSSLPLLRTSSYSKHNLLSRIRLLPGPKRSLVSWKSRGGRINKGIVATSATATTGAFVYFSWTTDSHLQVWNHLKTGCQRIWAFGNIVDDADANESKDPDVLDMFITIGYQDDWLPYPLYTLAHRSKKTFESSAFVKPNIVEILSPWEQSKSDDPWILLQLTKSSNFWVRQMGVACLANKVNWEAYKYRNVAQACDYRTLVGLARYDQANDAFFLAQPKLCQTQTDVLTDVQNLVEEMPASDTIQCNNIKFYRALALQKEILFQRDPITMDLVTHFYTTPGEEEKKVDQGLRYCLQALDAYTAESRYASLFVQLHGLAVLQRLHEERDEDWIQMHILVILNNLSLMEDAGKEFVRTGWIQKLRKWSKGDNIIFSVMADTILANVDRDWISLGVYKNMILLHPTQRNSLPVKADIILVHGLKGGAVQTWRQRYNELDDDKKSDCSDCWPKDWVSGEFLESRILSVGYNSTLHQWGDQHPYESERRTLEGRSEELIQHLMKAGVGDRPIIWIGHSMGGLLIKEILWLSEKNPSLKRLLDNTKGIILFSVPHQGSHIVDTMMYAKYLLFPSVEVQEMSTYSSKLKDLHANFVRLVSSYFIPCLSFGESVKTDFGGPFPSVLLVSQESSDPGIGLFFNLPANHVDVCKPCDKNDPMYLHTLHFLENIFKNLQP